MNNRVRQSILLIISIALFVFVILFVLFAKPGNSGKSQKIGFVMTGSIDETGWNGMNYKGIKTVCDKYGIKLIVKENIKEGTGECVDAVSDLADKGVSMIILSSYGYPEEVREIVDSYPEIAFYGNSAEYYKDNLSSYFGRMYQARYLSGIIAGMQTETDSIGYVAAVPNVEVIRGINAFTLGVKRVNPSAEVIVTWTGSWDDEEKGIAAVEKLVSEKNIDLVTYHQNRHYVVDTAEKLGIYSIGYNDIVENCSDKYLTAAVWKWEYLYDDIVKDFIQGKANSKQHHWCGIEIDAVELSEFSPLVSEECRAEIDKARQEILSGNDVFSGEIYDNEGVLRCEQDESLSDSFLMSEFEWYVDGVVLYEE